MNFRINIALLLAFSCRAFGQTPPAPASPVSISVDAGAIVRSLDRRFYGINLSVKSAILTLGPFACTRIPGGRLSDNYNWLTNTIVTVGSGYHWPASIGQAAEAVGGTFDSTGQSIPYITLNYGSGTPEEAAALVAYLNADASNSHPIGTDARGVDWKTAGYWAQLRGSPPLSSDDGLNLQRISHPTPFGFVYFEIGNENYASSEYDLHGVANSGLLGLKNDPFTYAQEFKKFQSMILAIDPRIKLGAVAAFGEDQFPASGHAAVNLRTGISHAGWTPVMLSTMKSIGVKPDFLISHYYAQDPPNENDNTLLQKGAEMQKTAVDLRQELTDYIGKPDSDSIELVMTELNSISDNPGKQSANLVNALFYADAYGNFAQTEYNAVLWREMEDGDGPWLHNNNSPSLYGWRLFGTYGLATTFGYPGVPDHWPLPTFYAAQLLTGWARAGDQIVKTSSNYDWLSAYGAKLTSGKLAILVINKHPSLDIPAQINLTGFSSGTTAEVQTYGKTNDTQGSNSQTAEWAFSPGGIYTFPSYSISVVLIDEAATAPTITLGPSSVSSHQGGNVIFSVLASGSGPITYQWYKESLPIDGATGSTLTLTNVQSTDAVSYHVLVTNQYGSILSSNATLNLADGVVGRLTNLSVRTGAGAGSNTLIVGFIVSGNGAKPIMVRGTGPTLAKFGVSGTLSDPYLSLFRDQTVLATNDSWQTTPNLNLISATDPSHIGSFLLDPLESIILYSIESNSAPTSYTAQLTGVGGAAGVGLVELFDTDTADPGTPAFNAQPRLTNISARARVGTGSDILIAGFIINGTVSKRVMIRATGPTLAKFGVAGVLTDPQLTLFRGDTVIAQNDNWGAAINQSEILQAHGDTLGTFSLNSNESVLIVTLPPNGYTAQVRGASDGTGVALIEVFDLD